MAAQHQRDKPAFAQAARDAGRATKPFGFCDPCSRAIDGPSGAPRRVRACRAAMFLNGPSSQSWGRRLIGAERAPARAGLRQLRRRIPKRLAAGGTRPGKTRVEVQRSIALPSHPPMHCGRSGSRRYPDRPHLHWLLFALLQDHVVPEGQS